VARKCSNPNTVVARAGEFGKRPHTRIAVQFNFRYSRRVPAASIRVRPEAVSRKDSGRFVRFEMMNIGLKIPLIVGGRTEGTNAFANTQFQYMDVGLNTAGDFMEGQKSLLGTSALARIDPGLLAKSDPHRGARRGRLARGKWW